MGQNNLSIALYSPQGNAVEIRREMVKYPGVKEALTVEEMAIFTGTTTREFSSYADAELITKCREIFDFVSGDVGYNRPDELSWNKIVFRLATIIKQYYPTFTADDILTAFELLAVGRLDAYLPKDAAGNPDRKHYQQFNVEYLSKVLNAYKRERCRVIQKAQKAVPAPEHKLTAEQCACYDAMFRSDMINSFLRYKYTGYFNCYSPACEMLIYNEFARLGFVEELAVNDKETIINCIFEKRDNNSNVAKLRRARLRAAYDEMIREEIQITELV